MVGQTKIGTILITSCFGSLLAGGVELGLSFLCSVMNMSNCLHIEAPILQ